ncbi:hypothetical protein MGYG_02459 [Nannizzia gypsea CBS 118893]|uniref:Uncharacterized protein n=1 Tax=Arthroderma gypseum (strain ATCC MYA-4604 / CBS 118893) TaxID=535722 RepID=E4UMN1_ARTGP|nr:hypothetical protein MGYG_02459 [Nannizzia gypsea CBS 118893]EFQ99448.1 hypothetical protein MGYG_02459 [Nannizzia gypsea CBS 118893]
MSIPLSENFYDNSDSDGSEFLDPVDDSDWEDVDDIVTKWGQPLVHFVRSPRKVARYLCEVLPWTRIPGEAVMAAAEAGQWGTLYLLFCQGGTPNMRAARASPPDADVVPGWATRDADIAFVLFECLNERLQVDWYPLQAAAHSWEMGYKRDKQLKVMRYLLEEGADPFALFRAPLARHKFFRYPCETFDEQLDSTYDVDGGELRNIPFTKFGTCSVLHSILETGGQALPFFDEKVKLDIEHRDPQGRTLLHSACRSIVGADALLNNAWNYKPTQYSSYDVQPSLFHALRLRNADMLAVDSRGQHIVHHLLSGGASDDAIHYTLTHLPQLANQPDYHGIYPLHTALQISRCSLGRRFENYAKYIEQFFAAGADPHARDGRGNTALHYIAASPIDGSDEEAKVGILLFKRFLELGVNVNARNNAGRSPVEIFLDDEDSGRSVVYKLPPTRSFHGTSKKNPYAYMNLQDLFAETNVDWAQRSANGQTLLHLVALQATPLAVDHAEYLLKKGVDASVKDEDGKMAADVAEQYGRDKMLNLLRPPPPTPSVEGK